MNAVCPLLLFAMAILTCNIHDRGKIFELKFGFSKKATRRQNLPAQTSRQNLNILSNVCVLLRKPKHAPQSLLLTEIQNQNCWKSDKLLSNSSVVVLIKFHPRARWYKIGACFLSETTDLFYITLAKSMYAQCALLF